MSILSTVTTIVGNSAILGAVLFALKKFMDRKSNANTGINNPDSTAVEMTMNNIEKQQDVQIEKIKESEIAQEKVQEEIKEVITKATTVITDAGKNTFKQTSNIINVEWDKL